MRVFIGIQIAAAVRERIVAELKPFLKMKSPIRWVAPEQIHLTLKFLGEVDADLWPRVENSLAAAWKGFASFSATIRGFGKFPSGSDTELTIFWAGIDDQPELLALQAEVERRLAAFPFKKETRPYAAHITLGRNKAAFNFKSLLARLEVPRPEPIATMRIDSFQVFQSTLAPQGPIYKVLREIALA